VSIFTHHWELKLIALVVSTILWAFVVTSDTSELILAAPLELDGIPSGLEIKGERPDSVEVQLHGLRATLAHLGPERVRARLSLAGARPGQVTLHVLPEQIVVPPGVKVVRVSPSRVHLVLGSVRS
jgi:hypothetical protein